VPDPSVTPETGASPAFAVDDESRKLIALARSARLRVGARSGAAVQDETGRTHAAVEVDRGSLAMSAIQLAVANALATGARGVAAAVVVGVAEPGSSELALLGEVALDSFELLICGVDGVPFGSAPIPVGST